MRIALIAAGFALVAISGCSEGTITRAEFNRRFGQKAPTSAPPPITSTPPRSMPAPVVVPTPVETRPVSLGEMDAAAILAEAKPKLGLDGRTKLLELTLHPGYAFLTVQDSKQLQTIDRYEWRGGALGAGGPVKLPSMMGSGKKPFEISEVSWKKIPALIDQTPKALGYADAKATHVIVTRNLPFSPGVVIRVYVSSERESGRIDYHADGRVARVFR